MRKLIALCVLVACGPDSGSGSIAIDDLGDAVAGEFCDIYVRCGVVADRVSCLELFGNDVSIDANLIAAVKAGKVIYHGDKARECLNAFAGDGTCDRTEVFGSRNQPAACDETFQGTAGDAGACAINEECLSADCNVPTCGAGQCCQGTCVGGTPPVHPTAGMACGTTAPSCSQSYCDTTTMLCTAYIADGGACQTSSSCQSGSCNLTTHTCQGLVATGGACTSSSTCKLIGDSCPTGTMTCTAVGASGAACGTAGDCQANLTCDPSKHCAARPAVGQSCAGQQTCVGSYCDSTSTTCTAYKADGATCMLSSECQSKTCDSTSHTCMTDPVCI